MGDQKDKAKPVRIDEGKRPPPLPVPAPKSNAEQAPMKPATTKKSK